MSNNDYMNQLLEQARNQVPVVDIKEVHTLINAAASAKVAAPYTISKTLKIILMTSISSIIMLLVFLWPNGKNEPTQSENIQETKSVVSANSAQPDLLQITPKHQENSPIAKNQSKPDKPIKPIPSASSHSPSQDAISDNQYASNPPAIEPNELVNNHETSIGKNDPDLNDNAKFFTLSDEEWSALHIKMRDNIFEYLYQPSPNSYYRCRITIDEIGGGTRAMNFNPYYHKKNMAMPLGTSRANGSDFYALETISAIELNSMANANELIGLSSNLSDDFIVWYKADEFIVDKLPNHVQQELENGNPNYKVEFRYKQQNETPDYTTLGVNYDPEIAIRVSKDEFESLGFAVKQNKIALKGLVNSKAVKFETSGHNTELMINSSLLFNRFKKELDPAPTYVSNQYWHSTYGCFASLTKGKEAANCDRHFMTHKHEYVPVVFNPDFDDTLEFVAWYEPSYELFTKLGVLGDEQKRIRQTLADRQLKDVTFNTASTPNYSFEQLFEEEASYVQGIRMLELDNQTLAKLNIFKENDGIVHLSQGISTKYDKKGSSHTIKLKSEKTTDSKTNTYSKVTVYIPSTGDTQHIELSIKDEAYIGPKLITDDQAQYWRMHSGTGPEIDSDEKGRYPENIQEIRAKWLAENIQSSFLIPVIVRTGQEFTPVDRLQNRLRPDCIFWYEPTEAFLAILPNEIADEIRIEMASIVRQQDLKTEFKIDLNSISVNKQDSAKSCQYFEICQNTKGAITQHSIYPNPAQEEVNVEIMASQTCNANISVATINGQVLLTKQIALTGEVNQLTKLIISDLKPGLYLINIETSAGDYFTQRIIKSN